MSKLGRCYHFQMNSLPPEIALMIFEKCGGKDIFELIKTSRIIRKVILENNKKLERLKLEPDAIGISIGRTVSVEKFRVEKTRGRFIYERIGDYDLTVSEFSNTCAVLCLAPLKHFHIHLRRLDEESLYILTSLNYELTKTNRILKLDIDRIEISQQRFRELLLHIRAQEIHLCGKFDRSIVSDDLFLGLPFLNSIFIGMNPTGTGAVMLSSKLFNFICNNWINNEGDASEEEEFEANINFPSCDIDVGDCVQFIKSYFTPKPNVRLCGVVVYGVPKEAISKLDRIISDFSERNHLIQGSSEWAHRLDDDDSLELKAFMRHRGHDLTIKFSTMKSKEESLIPHRKDVRTRTRFL